MDECMNEYYIAYGTGGRMMIYYLVCKSLSPVANIVFHVGDSNSVRGTWEQKYVGDHTS